MNEEIDHAALNTHKNMEEITLNNNNTISSDFDEVPIKGNSNANDFEKMILAMEEQQKKEQEMENSMPFEKKLASKNWKHRQEAFQTIKADLKNVMSGSQPELAYSDFLTALFEETHPANQEEVIDIMNTILSLPENCQLTVINTHTQTTDFGKIIKLLVDKFYSGKHLAKVKELILAMYETVNDTQAVSLSLLSLIDTKSNPKTLKSAINAITYVLSMFGITVFNPKSFNSAIEKVITHSNPIKLECYDYYKELFKWVKQKAIIDNLKDSYKLDLEKAFEDLTNADCKPTRFNKLKKSNNNTKGQGMIKEEYDFNVPINLFSPDKNDYGETWITKVSDKTTKWIEKKEQLDNCIKACSGKKISSTNRAYLIQGFKLLLKDSNINVVTAILQLITVFGVSFKKNYSEVKEYSAIIIGKLNEKNKKIVTEAMACLESLILNESVFADELKTSLDKSCSAQSKENTIMLIENILNSNLLLVNKLKDNKSSFTVGLKSLVTCLIGLTEDASNEVRNACFKLLALLKVHYGSNFFGDKLTNLAENKMKKIDEYYSTLNVTGNSNINNSTSNINTSVIKKHETSKMEVDDVSLIDINTNANANSSDKEEDSTTLLLKKLQLLENQGYDPLTAKNTATTSTLNTSNSNSNNNKPPQKLNNSKSTANLPTKNNLSNSNNTNNTANLTKNNNKEKDNSNDIEDEDTISPEDVDNYISNNIDNEIVSLSNSSKWDERKQAFTNLSIYLKNNINKISNETVSLIIKFIKFKLKDFKESNLNIVKEAIDVYETLLDIPGFSKKHTSYAIKKLLDKWGDAKLRASVNAFFIKLMENQTPKHVLNILLKYAANKTPNIIKEFNTFVVSAIDDFGIAVMPVKEIVDYTKAIANNANVQIRNGASSILCTIYKYLGDKLKMFLKDGLIKEATMKVIDAEFAKITVITGNNDKKRLVKGEENNTNNNNNDNNLIDSLFPRVDISKKITPKMIKDFTEGKWQQKKEVLDAVEKIINENNQRILPTGLGEFTVSIKNKLGDKNKNLVRIIISFLTKFFEALGGGGKSFSKNLLPGIIANLSDKMNLLREDVVKCLDVYIDQGQYESFIPYVNAFMVTDNYEFRVDMLNLLLKHKVKISTACKFDFKEMTPSVISCLMDRTPTVRNLAEEFLKEILRVVHSNYFYSHLSANYKPAQQSQLKPILEKYSGIITQSGQTGNTNSNNNNGVEINLSGNTSTNPTNNNNNIGVNAPKEINKNLNVKSSNNVNVSNNTNLSNTNNSNTVNSVQVNNSSNSNNNINNNNNNKNKEVKNRQSDPETKKTGNNNNIQAKTNNTNSNSNSNNTNNTNNQVTQQQFLKTTNIKPRHKQSRINHDSTLNFPDDFLTPKHIQALKSNMSMFITDTYVNEFAYSNDWNKINNFFSLMKLSLNNESFYFIEVLDLLLKWVLVKNYEMNLNCFFNNSLFSFLDEFLRFMTDNEFDFSVLELNIILEIMTMKIISNVNNVTVKERAVKVIKSLASLQRFLKVDSFIHFFSVKIIHYCSITSKKLELLEVLKSSVLGLNNSYDSKENSVEMILSLIIMPSDNSNFNVNPTSNNGLSMSFKNRNSINCNILSNNLISINNNNNNNSSDNCNSKNEIIIKINNLVFEIATMIIPQYNDMLTSILNKVNDYTVKNFLERNLAMFYKNSNKNASTNNTTNNTNSTNINNNIVNETIQFNNKNAFCDQTNYMSISKSPLIVNKTISRSNQASFNNILMMDDIKNYKQLSKESLLNYLETLGLPSNSSSSSVQTSILTNFTLILTEYWENNKEVIQNNLDIIITTISQLLEKVFIGNTTSNPNNTIDLNFTKYLLTFFYKLCLLCDFKQLSVESTFSIYSQLSNSLLYPNLDDLKSENFTTLTTSKLPEGKIIANSLNGIMLMLIEKVNPNTTIKALFDQMKRLRNMNLQFINNSNNNININSLIKEETLNQDFIYKLTILTAKCLTKVSEHIKTLICNNKLNIEELIECLISLTHNVELSYPDLKTNDNKVDDICIKLTKQFVYELAKAYCNSETVNEDTAKSVKDLWYHYTVVLETRNIPDKYVNQFLQLAVRSRQGQTMGVVKTRSLLENDDIAGLMNNIKSTNISNNINTYSNSTSNNLINSETSSINSDFGKQKIKNKIKLNDITENTITANIQNNFNNNSKLNLVNKESNSSESNKTMLEIDMAILKIVNSYTKVEKTQYILELFSLMKSSGIKKLDFLENKQISDDDIHFIKQEWLLINDDTTKDNKDTSNTNFNNKSKFNKDGKSNEFLSKINQIDIKNSNFNKYPNINNEVNINSNNSRDYNSFKAINSIDSLKSGSVFNSGSQNNINSNISNNSNINNNTNFNRYKEKKGTNPFEIKEVNEINDGTDENSRKLLNQIEPSNNQNIRSSVITVKPIKSIQEYKKKLEIIQSIKKETTPDYLNEQGIKAVETFMNNKEKFNSKHQLVSSSSFNFNNNNSSNFNNNSANINDLGGKLQENYLVNTNDNGIMEREAANTSKQMGQLGSNGNTIENLKSKLNQIRSKHQESKKAQM